MVCQHPQGPSCQFNHVFTYCPGKKQGQVTRSRSSRIFSIKEAGNDSSPIYSHWNYSVRQAKESETAQIAMLCSQVRSTIESSRKISAKTFSVKIYSEIFRFVTPMTQSLNFSNISSSTDLADTARLQCFCVLNLNQTFRIQGQIISLLFNPSEAIILQKLPWPLYNGQNETDKLPHRNMRSVQSVKHLLKRPLRMPSKIPFVHLIPDLLRYELCILGIKNADSSNFQFILSREICSSKFHAKFVPAN